MNTLIFFDINGTLITRDERTDIPFSNAANSALGTIDVMRGVDTSARSDMDVFMEICSRNGSDFTPEKWDQFLGLYINELTKFSSTEIWRANADAVPFVKALHERGYTLALITGELAVGAQFKLKKIGIWDCFLTGGYGEDGLKRFDIAETALKKVRERTKQRFDPMYVIGDTVLDIETARHLGAESVAITTGSHSRKKLLSAGPDHCIDKFSELESLFLQ